MKPNIFQFKSLINGWFAQRPGKSIKKYHGIIHSAIRKQFPSDIGSRMRLTDDCYSIYFYPTKATY